MNKTKKGFTLIELLVVIAIIALLAAAIIVLVGLARKKARDSRRVNDLKEIQTALEMYNDDHGNYPTITARSDQANWNNLQSMLSKYLALVPKDPSSNRHYYVRSDGNNYLLCADLEARTDLEQGDGRNNDWYELFSSRTVISQNWICQ